MAVDATCASDAAIASTLGTGSRSDQVCNWFERRPIALALALLAVLALLLAVTASLAARSGRYNVDTYSTMLAVELLKVPKTFDVKNSAPGYALLLTAISYVDPGLRAAVICHGTKSPCPEEASFKSLIRLQYVAGLIALLSILVLAYRLSGNRETALLALILTFAGSRLGADTARVGIVIWITASTYLCLALSVEAHLRKSITWSAGAGLVAGLTTILYPLAAVFSGALAITLALSFGRRSWPRGLGAGLAVLAGALAVPLIVYATMPGYGPAATGRALLLQLSERIGYQPTDVSSWLASLLLPIPFFGGWFELLFSDDPAPYVRRSYEIFASAQNIPGSPLAEYAWLIKDHIVGEAPAYLAATPGILNRGLWGGADLVALVGVFHLGRLVRYATADGRMTAVLILLAPTTALLVANTLLTGDPAWSNPAMPFVWAFAIAYVVARFPARSNT
jgi:hypothetical protein